jgi:hypothetical protein
MNSDYEAGTILDYHWGYEQTNVEFFKVLSRKGDWVTVQKMTAIETSDDNPAKGKYGTMTGCVIPGDLDTSKNPLRRKILRYRDGKPVGIRFATYAACAQPWDGTPKRVSHYA